VGAGGGGTKMEGGSGGGGWWRVVNEYHTHTKGNEKRRKEVDGKMKWMDSGDDE